ncbi:hypothetical protein D3C71_1038360 [compost metagenome]
MGDGRHHAGGLAHDAGQGLDVGIAQVGDELFYAKAADLFLITEGQVDGEGRVAVQELLGVRNRNANEGLHVCTATPIQIAVLDQSAQRVHGPVLPVPRHRVGVAREDHASGFALAQRGKQVGLGLVVVVGQSAFHAQLGQIVADEMDQLQVGVVADGVHAHQGLREFEGVGGECHVAVQINPGWRKGRPAG